MGGTFRAGSFRRSFRDQNFEPPILFSCLGRGGEELPSLTTKMTGWKIPHEDVFLIENGDVPMSGYFSGGYMYDHLTHLT